MNKLQIDKIVIGIILILAPAFILLLTSTMAQAKPTGARLAAAPTVTKTPVAGDIAQNKPATGSSSSVSVTGCTATFHKPYRAVDGIWTLNLSNTKWCSTNTPKWWQVDLGSNYDITQIRIIHAGGGGESAALNTRDFVILFSYDGTNWNLFSNTTGNTQNENVYMGSPLGRTRYIQIQITNGTQPGQDNAARIYEVIVQGTPVPAPVTPPTPFSTPRASATPVR